MKNYKTYGCKLSIETARREVESRLSLTFQERDSLYWGIYFLFKEGEAIRLELKGNVDPFDFLPLRSEFAEYPVLFYVMQPSSFAEIDLSPLEGTFDLLESRLL